MHVFFERSRIVTTNNFGLEVSKLGARDLRALPTADDVITSDTSGQQQSWMTLPDWSGRGWKDVEWGEDGGGRRETVQGGELHYI